MRVAALLPAHDEAERIGDTVRALIALESVDTVLVVDDGSTDDTAEVASLAGATVLRLEANAGKGAALGEGLATLDGAFDVLLLLDADLGSSAEEADTLLGPVLADDADMTIATMPRPAGSGGFGLVKGLARWGIQRFGGPFEPEAPLSGQRALTRSVVEVVTPFADGYGVEVALTIRALHAGFRVLEVPTGMSHAHTGKDVAGFAHRARQFVDVARTLTRSPRG